MQTLHSIDLWSLVRSRPQIDPGELAAALEQEVRREPLDFRTRLLIRDSLRALGGHWGEERLQQWVDHSTAAEALRRVGESELGEAGFPSLQGRLMESTRRETVLQLLRELGLRISGPATITIGGSIALILDGQLSRHTDDIDVVDEVPAVVRSDHALLEDLARRYGLQLTHFQSHYLPSGWESRLHSVGVFGGLTVLLVDPLDIFVGKLFSARMKDRDDLRILAPRFAQPTLLHRLADSAASFLADPRLRQQAKDNWYILFGEELPA